MTFSCSRVTQLDDSIRELRLIEKSDLISSSRFPPFFLSHSLLPLLLSLSLSLFLSRERESELHVHDIRRNSAKMIAHKNHSRAARAIDRIAELIYDLRPAESLNHRATTVTSEGRAGGYVVSDLIATTWGCRG